MALEAPAAAVGELIPDEKTVVTAEEILPQKPPQQLPQKRKINYRKNEGKVTAKLPQKLERNDDIFETDDFDFDFDFYGRLSSRIWRIERRFYTKQNGDVTMHYNYRKRKGKMVKGKRVNVYKKGGTKLWLKNHTN